MESAASLNSSPTNNRAGHCWCSSFAGSVCQGKGFTQGHPVTQQQTVERARGGPALRSMFAAAQPRQETCAPNPTASISSAKAQTEQPQQP